MKGKRLTQQQESVILKGVSSNILQMHVPSIDQANKLLEEFDLAIRYSKELEDDDDLDTLKY